jgi:hypothetical protein
LLNLLSRRNKLRTLLCSEVLHVVTEKVGARGSIAVTALC